MPIEAMAAGLPVVVSDWNGYKDTVRDGIDGFRMPTLMPQAGLGADLALRHALDIDTYDMHCGHACSLVAVDVQATAQAFVRRSIPPNFAARWARLAASGRGKSTTGRRSFRSTSAVGATHRKCQGQAKDLKPLAHPWPARMDPFDAFASYPTQALTPQTVLALVDADADTALKRTSAYRQLAMIDFAKVILPSETEIQAVLHAASAGPKLAAELLAGIPAERQPFVFRCLAWLVKLGVLAQQG